MQNKTSVRDAKRQYYKINWLERIAFGSGDMAQNFVYQTFTTYLLFFYTNIYHLDARIAATIFLVVRIINGVWDPIVGALVDRVTLPFGKYRGWMLFAVGPLCLLMILCFIVPELHPTGKIIYACATYIGVSMIYTVVNVPFGALNAALTRDPHEITILTTVRMWLVNLAQILVTYGVPNLVIYFSETHSNNSPDDADAWLTTALIFSAAGFIALLFSYFGTKEKVVISKEDSANIKATDLFKEIARNRPLRIIAYMFITTFAVLA
ncbi:MAG: MFS transporter, partial [Bifidobacteriaceae bacterium]|nr:MFS transporter [Bifidobacteriaceae bacterium]